MLKRRSLLMVPPALAVSASSARAENGFSQFLEGVRAEARRSGINPAIVDRALDGLQPNQKVLDLDRKQPEFTMTWERYRTTRLSDARIAAGQKAFAENRALVRSAASAYRVSPAILMGVWGLETNYGSYTGGFNVIEALATLSWEGRRASYFRTELIAALRILDHGDVTPARMVGSYAGAMGQPQFMPSSYLRFAVDFDGDGRRDIWDDKGDALASMANYLSRSGWRDGETWGVRVRLPPSFDTMYLGRETKRSVADWARAGVRWDGVAMLPRSDSLTSVIMPDKAGGDAYLVTPNFLVIRKYNPSDYYALAVGMLGDLVTT